jgi:tetratricopeptide (TPR) repeat protein
MPSSPQIKTPPTEFWERMTPKGFEDFCYEVLAEENRGHDIGQMRHSKDGGVDIFIRDQGASLEFFGSRLSGAATVQIEAKRRATTDIHNFARSLIAASLNAGCKSFVLITSADFNISTFFELSAFCRQSRIAFVYIHRELITRALIERQDIATIWGMPESMPDWNDIIAQTLPSIVCRWAYQRISAKNACSEITSMFSASERRDIQLDPHERIMVPVVLENWSHDIRELTVEIIGRSHWRMLQSSARTLTLEKRGAIGEQFIFELTAPQTAQLPRIQVETYHPQKAGEPARIIIHAGELHAQPFFEPGFVGKSALRHRKLLREFLEQQAAPSLPDERLGEWLLIEGSAGVGKSRIVEEALLKPTGGVGRQNAVKVCRYFVQPGGEHKLILDILRDLTDLSRMDNDDAARASKLIKQGGLTDAAIEAAAKVFGQPTRKPLLIVLEDLHHGSAIFYRWLQSVFRVTNIQAPGGSIFRFCITGRDDNSFPNPRQETFAETVKRHVQERNLAAQRIINVLPLDDDDAKTLVDSVFHGITTAARDRILQLSANVPFNILQVIEYLCEETLVEINERRTYSIRNDAEFYTKLGIPDSMSALLKLRLSHLARQPAGKGLAGILRCLSLLGLESSWSTYDQLVKTLAPNGDPWLLFNANYLTLDDGHRVRFSHENILNFLLLGRTDGPDWRKAANILTKQADILAELEEWRRCRILEIAGKDAEVAEIVTRVVGDGSVAGLARTTALGEVYQILHMGVALWKRRADDHNGAKFLFNLYFLWTYASKFTRRYSATVADAQQALEALRSHPNLEELVGQRVFNLACAKIEQIIGHTFQNIGNMDRSMTHVLSALTEARRWEVEEASHLDLLFDAEDRLRKNCIIFGRPAEARRAFQTACSLAERKKDDVLLGTGWYGEAELYFVQDPDRAETVWRKIERHAETHTDPRLRITLALALIQTQLLKSDAQDKLDECLDQLRDLGERSLSLDLVGPLPKVNLLSGYAYYKLGKFDRAIQQFLACYDRAEQFGYGVFLWFAQNNIALVHQHMDKPGTEAHVLPAFSAALDKAESLGFLRHLGTENPLFFQAALVENALRYYESRKLTLNHQMLRERLARNGYDLDNLPRRGLTHPSFETPFGAMMLFV